MKNEKGEAMLLIITILFISMYLFLIGLKTGHYQLLRTKKIARLYLCQKELNLIKGKFINNILNSDFKISLAYPLTFVPHTKAAAETTIKAMKLLQIKDLILFKKRVFDSQYCNKIQKATYLPSPFKINLFKFRRNINQTTILEKNKWSHKIFQLKPEKIVINSNFSITNGNLSISTREFSRMALPL